MRSLSVAPEREPLLRLLGMGAWLVLTIVVIAALGVWVAAGAPRQPAGYVQGLVGVASVALTSLVYGSVGALLLRRRPGDPIGWLFLAISAGMALVIPLNQVVAGSVHPFRPIPSLVLLAAWAVGCVHLPASGAAVTAVLVLVPSGRAEGRHWRLALALALLGSVLLAVATALRPGGLLWYPTLPNPTSAPPALTPIVPALAGAGVAALVAGLVLAASRIAWRYREAPASDRRQLTWLTLGSAAMVASVALLFIARYVELLGDEEGERLAFVAAVGSTLLPLGMLRFTHVSASRGQEAHDLTFLFTDLKDSTEMYERVGDRTAFDLVRLHFNTLEAVTRDHGGTIVKTIGDAIMATFPDPGEAVRTALAMFERLERFNRSSASDLVLKVGLHRGNAIAVTSRGRRDYFGQTVNIASRLGALAGAGEIVMSEEVFTAPEVAGLLEGRDIRHERSVLRGVAGEVPVYRTTVAGHPVG